MRHLFFIIVVLIPLFFYSQKQGNVWLFGNQSGLDFNTGSPVVFTGGKISTYLGAGENQEGTGCISDSSGNLLFYSGGKTIWNKAHQVMLNGSGIMGGTSSTQAALIIPKPGSDTLFYVFTSDEFQSYTSPPQKGYRFSVVDMSLDNCNGGVILGQKNILLMDSAAEKLSACLDSSGTGYWILGHKMFSNQFTAWHLTSAGITATVTSNIGTIHGWNPSTASWWGSGPAQGQMKINSAGTKIALVIGNYQPAILDLFNFNSSTGSVSNACHIVIDSALAKSVYGVEFSPDGSKLYTTHTGGSGPNMRLYQFDLMSGGGACISIRASQSLIWQSNTNGLLLGLQLAPDNKIYVTCLSQNNLARINSPNLTGTLCNFDSMAVTNANLSNFYALPSFIAGYKYSNGLAPSCGRIGIHEYLEEQLVFRTYPNPSSTKITVEFLNSDNQFAEIRITNQLGEIVYEHKQLPISVKEIFIDNLSNGSYFIQVKTKQGLQTEKLVIIR